MTLQGSDRHVLNPAQQAVADHALLDSGFSCVLQMPTGSGKTWLARAAIRDSVRRGFRGVFLAPLRAMAEELAAGWRGDFGGAPVGIFTGDYSRPGASYPVPYGEARVLVMTPERLDACTRNWRAHWAWIPEVDWLVADEIHLLADAGRGPRLEGAISRFRRLNPFCRILGLSATLGNREELADWLEGVEFQSAWRPVPLRWRIARYRKADEKPDLLAGEVAAARDRGGQSIVFVQSRRRAESLARHLSERGLGAAHHHAGLAHRDRRSTEELFRSGGTRVLVATGTLEMGLNLPARQVVLYDLQAFDGCGFSPLAVNTVWQRAGRAGRPGLDPEGEAVLLAPAWDRAADRYPSGRFERIESGLGDPAALAEQVLAEVQSGLARSRPQLERVFAASLAARQRKPPPLATTLKDMIDSGMLWEKPPAEGSGKSPRLSATPLGRIATRHMLRPDTVLGLTRFLERHPRFTFLDLIVAAACTGDCEPLLAADFEELESLADSLARQTSFIFSGPRRDWADAFPVSGRRLLSALKIATVLWRWTLLGDADLVAEEEGCYPFEISRLQESIDRLLLAAAAIRRLIDEPPRPDKEERGENDGPREKSVPLRRIELWRQMVLAGLDERAATLTFVDGIGARWARKLVASGIPDLASLALATKEAVVAIPGLGEKRASAWPEAARNLGPSPLPECDAPRLCAMPGEADIGADPYRLRRALDLHVEPRSPAEWVVSGGLEPHRVHRDDTGWACDCPDHAKGHTCKHVLATRLAAGDPELARIAETLRQPLQGDHLDLFALWFERETRPS